VASFAQAGIEYCGAVSLCRRQGCSGLPGRAGAVAALPCPGSAQFGALRPADRRSHHLSDATRQQGTRDEPRPVPSALGVTDPAAAASVDSIPQRVLPRTTADCRGLPQRWRWPKRPVRMLRPAVCLAVKALTAASWTV
jgi:hypothetical protein